LIVAEEGAHVSYLEGCTAQSSTRISSRGRGGTGTLDNAEIKYSTVQNWYAGDENGRAGIYNFVTKRGLCKGVNSKISWTQVETGSAITWKYPSCICLATTRWRILFGGANQSSSTGGYRHQDGPRGPEYAQQDHIQGISAGVPTTAIAVW
jgi:Fe-S cluster assembly scaffold protein SufB